MVAPANYPVLPGRKPRSYPNTPEVAERIRANLGIAYSAAKRAWGRGHEPYVSFDDVLSASLRALWRCAAAFDPVRGFKFSTLAYQPCFRAACQVIRIDRGRVRIVRARSFDDMKRRPIGARAVVDDLIEREDAAADASRVRDELGRLDERTRRILTRRVVDGMKLEEIGVEEGLSKERVRQICETAMGKMQRGIVRRRWGLVQSQ